jgi:hypothetical protein
VTIIVVGKSRGIASSVRQSSANQDPPGTIDGAVNKDLIPDNAAYTTLLRFVAYQAQADKPKADKAFALSYLKFNGFEDADIKAIMAAADEFQKRVAVIDGQIEKLNPSTVDKLEQLRKQQDDLVQEFANSFSVRLSSKGQEKMNYLIQHRIKSKMKIIPAPQDLGSLGSHKQHQ